MLLVLSLNSDRDNRDFQGKILPVKCDFLQPGGTFALVNRASCHKLGRRSSRLDQGQSVKNIYIYLFILIETTRYCVAWQGTREAIILCNGAYEKRSNQQQ